MHNVSGLWREIFAELNHRKEVMVKVNGVEYHEDRILYPVPSVVGKLFDAPSVGNARARTLTLNLMPYDGPQGHIPPMSEILIFVRLKSADGGRVSEYIQKGVFYADEVKRDGVTGATRITAFDAMMKMERPIGNAVVRVTFDDGFKGYQHFKCEIGNAMPTPDTPTHEGERFAAWYPNPADTQTVVRDMLFMAHWVKKFNVTFNSGSGTPQTFSVFSGDATPTPTAPTKSGYLFTGWAPTPAATVTADVTYTAQWTELKGRVVQDGGWWTATDEDGYSRLYIHCDGPMPDYYMWDEPGQSHYDYEDKDTMELSYIKYGSPPDSRPYGEWIYRCDELIIADSVTSIGVSAFRVDWEYHNYNDFRVSIADSVTSIGAGAFACLWNIGDLKIPDSVTSIGYGAFYRTGADNLELSGNLAEIGDSAFEECGGYNGKTLIIPKSVRKIGSYAFYDLNASGLYLPHSLQLQYVGACAFREAIDGNIEFEPIVIDASHLEFVGYDAFGCYIGGELVLSPSVELDEGAFEGTKITGVTIPEGVTTLRRAFSDCENLTSVTIPNSVTDIRGAFKNCVGLTNVTIPASVEYIGNVYYKNGTFEGCSNLRSVTFAPGTKITEIGQRTFTNCASLTSVKIPEGITAIRSDGSSSDSGAFYGCVNLASLTLPLSVTFIQEYAFGPYSYNSGSLTDIYYAGTQSQWEALVRRGGNSYTDGIRGLVYFTWKRVDGEWQQVVNENFTWHFNSSGPS